MHANTRNVYENTHELYLSLAAGSARDELEVVEWTLELLVELDAAELWQRVRLVTARAVHARRLGRDQLHVAPTLATPVPRHRTHSVTAQLHVVHTRSTV